MDGQSRTAMTEFYSELLEAHGPTKEAIAYSNEKQQATRYALMAEIGPMGRESSVLDIGCGLGHFCEYLREHGWEGKYLGVDINPDMVQAAQERLPGEGFVCGDILSEEFGCKSDFVFCGATIQHRPKHGDPQEYLERMAEKMFELTNVGLAFDIFSARGITFRREHHLYVDPMELLAFCYQLTGRVVLRNDCRPYELMVYLFKDESREDLNIYSSWAARPPQFV